MNLGTGTVCEVSARKAMDNKEAARSVADQIRTTLIAQRKGSDRPAHAIILAHDETILQEVRDFFPALDPSITRLATSLTEAMIMRASGAVLLRIGNEIQSVDFRGRLCGFLANASTGHPVYVVMSKTAISTGWDPRQVPACKKHATIFAVRSPRWNKTTKGMARPTP